MSVSNYLRQCGYSLGSLKPYVYLIPKKAVSFVYEVNNYRVGVTAVNNLNSEFMKLNCVLVTIEQNESYKGKFAFSNKVEISVEEQYNEGLYDILMRLKRSEHYIIIEDNNNNQWLVNPELNTSMTYEYVFTDAADNVDTVTITYQNLSNHPLLIMKDKISFDEELNPKVCRYNKGQIKELHIGTYDKNNASRYYRIEWLKETMTYSETYDGKEYTSRISFSIPLQNYLNHWPWRLIEFSNNTYKAMIVTSNNNALTLGRERGMFPSYAIVTSANVDEPNTVNITLTVMTQYAPECELYKSEIYRWVVTQDTICENTNLYQSEKRQISTDFGATWQDVEPLQTRKGKLIERYSDVCGFKILERWTIDESLGYRCINIQSSSFMRTVRVNNEYICIRKSKYEKLQIQTSTDGETWTNTDQYVLGDLIEIDSSECP